MPFSRPSLDFLAENVLNDSRAWFKAHRAEYDALVLAPMQELVVALTPTMLAIDDAFQCEPRVGRTISRIYRDTRFSRNKSIYRDVIWLTFMREKRLYEGLPGFFAEVSPSGYRYGCGYYQASGETMAILRGMVQAGEPAFRAAQRAFDGQRVFSLLDERYKRTRHPDQPEELRRWLDQRSICLAASGADFDLLFSDRFAKKLARDFKRIAAVYHFLMEVERRRPHSVAREEAPPDPFLGY